MPTPDEMKEIITYLQDEVVRLEKQKVVYVNFIKSLSDAYNLSNVTTLEKAIKVLDQLQVSVRRILQEADRVQPQKNSNASED